MSCDGCSSRLKKIFDNHPEVEQAEVDHVNGTAMIAGKITEEMAAEMVEKAGFTYAGKDAP